MSGLILILVLSSSALHPIREFFIKSDATPEGVTLGVNISFWVIAGSQVFSQGMDPLAAFKVWPMVVISGLGLLVFYGCLVASLRTGDLSIYYPITRSSPLFVVIVGYLFLNHVYSAMMLGGIALVLIGAFFLQFRPGSRLFDQPVTLTLATIAMCSHGVITLADAEAMQHVEPAEFLFFMYIFVIPAMSVVLCITRPQGRSVYTYLFSGWIRTPFRFSIAGATAYASYYMILWAFQLGANVAAVSAVRQISIPVSVVLGCLIFKEERMTARLAWSVLLAVGVATIVMSK